MAADNPIGLRIPERSPPGPNVSVRPRDLEGWLGGLPMGNATETASRLRRALEQLNRTQIPPADRVQIAELFSPPVTAVVAVLERQFRDVGFPLSDKAKAAAEACAGLDEAMATAYKEAAHDTARGRLGPAERRVLVVALSRAVSHAVDRLYQAALVYQAPPPVLWAELHNMFNAATANETADVAVQLLGGAQGQATTLRSRYIQGLLLAAASPSRLRQREIAFLRRKMPDWAALVTLVDVQTPSDTATRFYVPIYKDAPPLPSALVRQGVSRAALELDTAPLIGSLRQTFDALPADTETIQPGGNNGELSRAGVRRLIQAWGSVPKREFARTRLNFEMKIAVGLVKIHHLLTRGSGPEPALDPPSLFVPEADALISDLSLTLEPVPGSGDLDVESNLTLIPLEYEPTSYTRGYVTFGPGARDQRRQPPSPPPIWKAGAPPSAEQVSPSVLHTANESLGGYCIHWRGRKVPPIKIGELVGVQSPTDPNQYGLAVARWMACTPPDDLRVGLQVLAPSVLPVMAETRGQGQDQTIMALVIPKMKSAGQPASLILPLAPWREGKRLTLRHEQTERPVRLQRLLESTGAFARFLYEYE